MTRRRENAESASAANHRRAQAKCVNRWPRGRFRLAARPFLGLGGGPHLGRAGRQ
jgi:hypothetical protein